MGLATGSVDGFLEIWDASTYKLKKDLSYQANDKFMLHSSPVLCVSFSRVLKEFRGHTSYVNHAIYLGSGQQILSASSDGTVSIWDAKTTECTRKIRPPQRHAADEASVVSVHPYPKNTDYFVVCNRSPVMYLMTQKGQVVKSFAVEAQDAAEPPDFVAACVSTRGEYLYGLASDSHLYAFQMETCRLEERVKVSEKEVIGVCHHPLKVVVATWSLGGVNIYQP